jgi:hypothetical protein
MNYWIFSLLFLQGLAAVVGWLFRPKFKNTILGTFPFYLTFIFLGECVGFFTQKPEWKQLNETLHEFFIIPIEFIYFFWLLSKATAGAKSKKILFPFILLYLVSLVIENLIKTQFIFLSISYTLGNLLLLILIIRYLFQLISSDEILTYSSNPFFYISIGLLLFYLGTFPFYALKNYLWAYHKQIGLYYWYSMMVLNCMMYAMFTLSFIWRPRKSLS